MIKNYQCSILKRLEKNPVKGYVKLKENSLKKMILFPRIHKFEEKVINYNAWIKNDSSYGSQSKDDLLKQNQFTLIAIYRTYLFLL